MPIVYAMDENKRTSESATQPAAKTKKQSDEQEVHTDPLRQVTIEDIQSATNRLILGLRDLQKTTHPMNFDSCVARSQEIRQAYALNESQY